MYLLLLIRDNLTFVLQVFLDSHRTHLPKQVFSNFLSVLFIIPSILSVCIRYVLPVHIHIYLIRLSFYGALKSH